METPQFRKIRVSQKQRIKRQKSTGLETDWDTQKSSGKKNFRTLLWASLLVGAVLFTAVGAALMKPKTQVGSASGEYFKPAMITHSTDQEKEQKEIKMALACVAAFFGQSNDMLRVVQCRPVPGLVKIFEINKPAIVLHAQSAPSPGGNIKRQPPFIGIPISFTGLPPRTAWVEVRGTAARLDLESFVGHGMMPWSELENTPAGTPVFLRGTLVPMEGSDDRMYFISPDGKVQILIKGRKPNELNSPRAARVTVARVAETSVISKGWLMVAFEGWEWLADHSKEATPQ